MKTPPSNLFPSTIYVEGMCDICARKCCIACPNVACNLAIKTALLSVWSLPCTNPCLSLLPLDCVSLCATIHRSQQSTMSDVPCSKHSQADGSTDERGTVQLLGRCCAAWCGMLDPSCRSCTESQYPAITCERVVPACSVRR